VTSTGTSNSNSNTDTDTADTLPRTASLRTPAERGATLGTSHLGLGAGMLCAIQAMYGLATFGLQWTDYPSPYPILTAWLLYLVTFAGAVITVATLGSRFPHWAFGVFVLMLSGVVYLDFVAIWPLHNIGQYATVSVSAGFGMLLIITLISRRKALVATGALAAAFVVAIALNTPLTPHTIPTQLTAIAVAVMPVVLAVVVLHGFRRMVQVELDRVLVKSTVSAPRFAVGMLASEELARLDAAAEDLLDDVAVGRTQLPLTPETASIAASLATELRLHLIEGRRETWLYHAVTESEALGKVVTLVDRGSLSGLLDPSQRDGLLSAVWLLVHDTPRPKDTRTVQITVGPALKPYEPGSGNRIAVPIVITTTGVPRNRVDLATWESVRKIGRYSDSTQDSSLRLDIVCMVDNPVDH
jgi:hypothetical protein